MRDVPLFFSKECAFSEKVIAGGHLVFRISTRHVDPTDLILPTKKALISLVALKKNKGTTPLIAIPVGGVNLPPPYRNRVNCAT